MPDMNAKLIPQLQKMAPGSRVITHEFDIPGIQPDQELTWVSKQDNSEHLIFVYSIPLQRQPWRLYAGGGPAANVYKFSRPASGETDISGGFNLLVGVQHSRGLFSELKVGAMDSPTLKFTLGYAFR